MLTRGNLAGASTSDGRYDRKHPDIQHHLCLFCETPQGNASEIVSRGILVLTKQITGRYIRQLSLASRAAGIGVGAIFLVSGVGAGVGIDVGVGVEV